MMNNINELTNNAIFHYAVIFARLGSIMLFIPGFGEAYVSARARLGLALLFCLVVYPIISPKLPPMPADILYSFLILAGEITIGIFIGLMMRIIQGTLHIAGMKIAFMTGLSTATLFDANQSTQGSVIGGFLSVIGITLFFTTNLDHVVFKAIAESYDIMLVAQMPPFNEFAETAGKLLSESFFVAFRISAPVILVGLMLYLAAGLMGRLMPTMQVFFILMPIQIYVGFLFMGLALSGMMLAYMSFFQDKILELF
jgi:flagellar biosynthetic protein FliR